MKHLNEKQHLELWLNYTPYYIETNQHEYGIVFTETLIKQFGDDHRLYANLGAFQAMIKDDNNAIKNLEKAVKINPNSPLNTWNLARLYDYQGKYKKADQLYERALSLKAGEYDTDLEPNDYCVYAEFLYERAGKKAKACEMFKSYCKSDIVVCE